MNPYGNKPVIVRQRYYASSTQKQWWYGFTFMIVSVVLAGLVITGKTYRPTEMPVILMNQQEGMQPAGGGIQVKVKLSESILMKYPDQTMVKVVLQQIGEQNQIVQQQEQWITFHDGFYQTDQQDQVCRSVLFSQLEEGTYHLLKPVVGPSMKLRVASIANHTTLKDHGWSIQLGQGEGIDKTEELVFELFACEEDQSEERIV